MAENFKRLFSIVEAAQYLGIPPKRIYNAVAPGATEAQKALFPVPAKRRGKRWFFEKNDLDAHADSLEYAE